MSDKHMGKLTYIRIYSGSLESGSSIWNATQQKKQRVGRLKNAFKSTRSNR